MMPVITHSFASREIRPGDTWKVYLNAQALNDDMKAIICTLHQAGRGTYPITIVRIREGQRKELSGFLYLNTAGAQGLAFANLTLRIEIQDDAGNFGEPVSFPFTLNPRAVQAVPPAGIFQDRELGPIMISLETGMGGP